MRIILADNQDITRAGLLYLIGQIDGCTPCTAADKTEMLQLLRQADEAVVVMDYTLYDVNDIEELVVITQYFTNAQWVIFSEDLTPEFMRRVFSTMPQVSMVLKESSMGEIRECLNMALKRRRFICQRITELLLTQNTQEEEKIKLTKTECEILKDIALGMTTRDIAEKRFSSFHTVNTHRKNIFRKLGVNNAHEATKYALRAGLVDAAEYYI